MAIQATSARWSFAESVYMAVIVLSLTMLAALLGSIYYWMNWNRMADTCSLGSNVSYSFSISHGFTCTSSSGKSESKWWW
jgi:hypothetical protein